jgi:hypothetical protein
MLNRASLEIQLASALILVGLSFFLTQKLTAAQALAVASNGKWAMATDIYGTDISAVSAQALAECKAKGGTDAKIVWSEWTNVRGYNWRRLHHGAIAVSDNGNGMIVGWSFDRPKNGTRAKEDCQKKGGQHPKVVARF